MSFSYLNDSISEICIEDNLKVHIVRQTNAIARVHFVDAQNNELAIPHGFTLRDGAGMVQIPFNNNFLVAWVER